MSGLETVALIASIAGTGLSALGQYQAAKTAEDTASYNAAIALRKAQSEEETSRDKFRKLMASQRAKYALAGVDLTSGSPLVVMSLTAAEGEKEALSIRTGGYEEAAQETYYGKTQKKAGMISAGSTLLTGLGQTAGSYYSGKKLKGIK